jgi:hypothetical protein
MMMKHTHKPVVSDNGKVQREAKVIASTAPHPVGIAGQPTKDPATGAGAGQAGTPQPGAAPEQPRAKAVPGQSAAQGTAPSDNYERRFLDTLNRLIGEEAAISPSTKLFQKSSPHESIGRLINLTRKLAELENNAGLYQQAYYAATLLLRNTPLLTAAAAVLDDIDFSTSKNSPIYLVMRGIVRAIVMFVALAACLVASAWLVFLLAHVANGSANLTATLDYFVRFVVGDILLTPLFLSALFGTLGSIVSIILRLSEFERCTRTSRQFLLMTGMLLPIVGAIFAAISCAMFRSGIINFAFAGSAAPVGDTYFYMVLGFLSGFSERFTRGLLGSAEDAFTVARRTQQQTIANASGAVVSTAKTEEVLQAQQ